MTEHEPLTAEDSAALAVARRLDTPEKVEAQAKALLADWEPWIGDKSLEMGFPKLETRHQKLQMAILLENQFRFQRSREQRVIRRGNREVIAADVTTGDEALPTTFALAMVRRAYAFDHIADWQTTQALTGPTGFVFYVDFLRESDNTNLLSSEYTYAKTLESAVPKKAKIKIARDLVTADKQLLATVYSLEAEEDAMNQLGLDIANEMVGTFSTEFVRNRFAEHLQVIYQAALTGVASGSSLPAPWSNAGQPAIVIPNIGTDTTVEWGRKMYNSLEDGNGTFQKLNRRRFNGIVCGIDVATRLNKAVQVVDIAGTDQKTFDNDLGVNSYGNFAGRYHIWATDLLPANVGFAYVRNPDPLRASAVYAPYVPIQVMQAVYGGYDPVTGNYQNTDEYTRNIRERSAFKVTRPYGFLPITLG